MTAVAAPQASFLEMTLPNWFAPIPEKTKPDQKILGDWCRVTVHKKNAIRKFHYTQEISTGDLYGMQEDVEFEKPYLIAFNAMRIFIATPFWMLGTMAVNLIKAVVGMEVTQSIWRIARSPIYALGMMLASLFTMICPLKGSTWLASIEYEWHQKTSYRRDIRYRLSKKEIRKKILSCRFISDIKEGKVLYLTYCMQKRGNIREPRFKPLYS